MSSPCRTAVSFMYGEVVEMAGGLLSVKTASSTDSMITIKWSDVAVLEITHLLFHLKEGTILNDTASPALPEPSISGPTPFKGQCVCPSNNLAPMSDH